MNRPIKDYKPSVLQYFRNYPLKRTVYTYLDWNGSNESGIYHFTNNKNKVNFREYLAMLAKKSYAEFSMRSFGMASLKTATEKIARDKQKAKARKFS